MVLPENIKADRRPTCGECRFYVDHGDLIEGGRPVGDCHMSPPTPMLNAGTVEHHRPQVGVSDVACGWFIPAAKHYDPTGIDPYGKLIPN